MNTTIRMLLGGVAPLALGLYAGGAAAQDQGAAPAAADPACQDASLSEEERRRCEADAAADAADEQPANEEAGQPGNGGADIQPPADEPAPQPPVEDPAPQPPANEPPPAEEPPPQPDIIENPPPAELPPDNQGPPVQTPPRAEQGAGDGDDAIRRQGIVEDAPADAAQGAVEDEASAADAGPASPPDAGEAIEEEAAGAPSERRRGRDGEAGPDDQGQAANDVAVDEAVAEDSVVEDQLSTQGDTEQAERVRALREKVERALEDTPDESVADDDRRDGADRDRSRRDRDRADRDRPEDRRNDGGQDDAGREVVDRNGDRVIIRLDGNLFIDRGRAGDTDRLLQGARDVEVVDLPGGLTQTTVFRENGSQVVTVRDRFGDIIERRRITADGRVVVLIDSRDIYRERPRDRDRWVPPIPRFEEELPPLRVEIPDDEYIVESRRASRDELREALLAPPVEEVERVYALDEIRYSERLRDKLRRVDLDTITFEFGSAAIPRDQFDALIDIAEAIEAVLAEEPDAVFLVEGHTDAVGSNEANLVLSDRRAEAVAVALSSNFEIPPENLVTQGYGEEDLKIETPEPERENRRVALRNITSLLQAAER